MPCVSLLIYWVKNPGPEKGCILLEDEGLDGRGGIPRYAGFSIAENLVGGGDKFLKVEKLFKKLTLPPGKGLEMLLPLSSSIHWATRELPQMPRF